MSDFGDFRTPEERAADEAEELQQVELVQLERQLDDEHAALDKLADQDPVGLVWFGDDDAWVDKRL